MKPTKTTQSTTSPAKLKMLLVAIALIVAAIIGIAAGDPASMQETSEAAMSWATARFGWSWL